MPRIKGDRLGRIELDVGVKPIASKFMETNYLFALEFWEGFVFGRVVRRRICQYKPYPVVDAAGNAVDIPPASHQAELRFRDSRNTANDILFLDAATNSGYPWFFHGSIGIKPQQVYMYIRFPEGKDIPGKFPEVDAISPSSGDNLGYVNELNSPYDEPTDWVELVIPPHLHIGAEYYNKDSARSHQPVLNLLFALYWVQLFSKDKNQAIIRKIANREVPATFLTVGVGDIPQPFGSTLEKEWGVKPIKLEEAML